MKTHIIGASIDWLGEIASRSSLVGWRVNGDIRGVNFHAQLNASVFRHSNATMLRIFASPEEQKRWNPGEALIDLTFTSPTGRVLITPRAAIRLVNRVGA